MSKKKQRDKDAQAPPTMAIDTILEQLASMKDSAAALARERDADAVWQTDVDACEAATAILSALQDEGIHDPEQVRDLIHDYNALAEQYRKMHQQYEEPAPVLRLGSGARAACLCPVCRNQSRPGNAYCWNCGKRLDWNPLKRR